MCLQDVRECSTCGWSRPWLWHKCATYLEDELAACAQGERCYRPEECENTKKYGLSRSEWPLKCPPLQCGNPDCPDKSRAQAVRREIEEQKQRQRMEFEEEMRMRREAKDRQVERFSRKYFVKRLVLSVEEQLDATEELERTGEGMVGECAVRRESSGRHVRFQIP